MKVLGVITWFCLSSIVSALVQAWTMTKLWAWFVSLEYGPGPSMGAWFGIMTILGLVIGMALLAQADTTKESNQDESLEDVIKRSIYIAVGKWAACFLVLAISWVTGSVLGWVH